MKFFVVVGQNNPAYLSMDRARVLVRVVGMKEIFCCTLRDIQLMGVLQSVKYLFTVSGAIFRGFSFTFLHTVGQNENCSEHKSLSLCVFSQLSHHKSQINFHLTLSSVIPVS